MRQAFLPSMIGEQLFQTHLIGIVGIPQGVSIMIFFNLTAPRREALVFALLDAFGSSDSTVGRA